MVDNLLELFNWAVQFPLRTGGVLFLVLLCIVLCPNIYVALSVGGVVVLIMCFLYKVIPNVFSSEERIPQPPAWILEYINSTSFYKILFVVIVIALVILMGIVIVYGFKKVQRTEQET